MLSNDDNGPKKVVLPLPEGIEIRPLTAFDEIDETVALQRLTWDDPTTVIYPHMLISLIRNGGQLLGAIRNGRVVGFLLSYLGTDLPDPSRPAMANLKLVSQRMAVLPDFRSAGIGYALKLAQREYAVQQGIRLITWTFDPLNSRNAHLNIRKLGCMVQHYDINYYGTQPSPLVNLDQSDRLVAEWRVTSARVEHRLLGTRSPLRIDQYMSANTRIVNPSIVGAKGLLQPGNPNLTEGLLALVEIPTYFDRIAEQDEALARAWRAHCRAVFTQAIRAGYIATDFIHAEHEGRERSFYVFSASEAIQSFSSNAIAN